MFKKISDWLYTLFNHRRIIREYKIEYDGKYREVHAIEEDIKGIFKLLDKEGCTMLLFQMETSFANYCKITDRTTNGQFELYHGRVVPSVKQVAWVVKMIKKATKDKKREAEYIKKVYKKKGVKSIAKVANKVTKSQKDNKKSTK